MAVVMQDLAGQYLRAIDNFACDNLVTAASSDGVWDLTAVDLFKVNLRLRHHHSCSNKLPANAYRC